MTEKRVLANKTELSRIPCPHDPAKHIYFVEGGKEGHVMVIDTYMSPLDIVLACAAWELDKPPPEYPTRTMEFNRK